MFANTIKKMHSKPVIVTQQPKIVHRIVNVKDDKAIDTLNNQNYVILENLSEQIDYANHIHEEQRELHKKIVELEKLRRNDLEKIIRLEGEIEVLKTPRGEVEKPTPSTTEIPKPRVVRKPVSSVPRTPVVRKPRVVRPKTPSPIPE